VSNAYLSQVSFGVTAPDAKSCETLRSKFVTGNAADESWLFSRHRKQPRNDLRRVCHRLNSDRKGNWFAGCDILETAIQNCPSDGGDREFSLHGSVEGALLRATFLSKSCLLLQLCWGILALKPHFPYEEKSMSIDRKALKPYSVSGKRVVPGLQGVWQNELGSTMTITSFDGTTFGGTYSSAVGDGQGPVSGTLAGTL
jgi:Avidin family